MEKKTKITAAVLFIIFLVALFFVVKAVTAKNYNSFASCLTEKGVVMYGTDWCSHCQKQKKMFGDAFKNILFVDCDTSPECDTAGVKAYPTWSVDGKLLESGVQQLETLSRLSGCKLPD